VKCHEPDTGAFAGNTGIFSRQAYIGLSNQYGKITFGKQYSSLAEGILNFSPTRTAPAYEPASGGWASTTGRATPSSTWEPSARCPPQPTIRSAPALA
jgi:predicted porin